MPPLATRRPAALFSSFVPLSLFFAALTWLNLLPIKVNKISKNSKNYIIIRVKIR